MAAVVAVAWVVWAEWICRGLTLTVSRIRDRPLVLYESSVGPAWRSIFFEMTGGHTPASLR